MSRPRPFAYPKSPHVRRHNPAGYTDHKTYKPWLRDEFHFRCVYCLRREMWTSDREAAFSVDHIVPQSDPVRGLALQWVYTNLLYACLRCNYQRNNKDILDPTIEPMAAHLIVDKRGRVQSLTNEGQDLIDLLKLNTDPLVRERERVLRVLAQYKSTPTDPSIRQNFLDTFEYPEDLPDLRDPRPVSNSLAHNVANCYAVQRLQNRLPETY